MAGRAVRGYWSNRVFFAAVVAGLGTAPLVSLAAVTLTQNSSTNWTINNGLITGVFNPSSDNISSVQLGGSTNLLSKLDEEFAGTPFGSGPQTFGSKVGPNGSYADVWTSTASAQNSSGGVTNPITYSFHYLVFANDPTVYCYEVLNHAATDVATSVGQGQFLFRSVPSLFPNLYQINTEPNQLGTANATTRLNVASTASSWGTVTGQAGRTVQDATHDLTGSTLAGDNGTDFFTKYDFSIYTQFYQAETMYGSSYAVTEVDPSTDSLSGGPTKQELAWTDPGILNMEFLSGHYGIGGSGPGGAFPGYSYYPPQGVASSKLYGPYGFTISSISGTTAAAINQNVINSIPNQQAQFNTDTELAASGYVNTTTRGIVQANGVSNSAGWSANTSNNTVVLSDSGVNFQESKQGYQYVGQLSAAGNVTIGNVVPGTYRLSIYQLGQWGETRVDGVQVNGNTVSLPKNLKFTPQNFGSSAPIWTIGTPNRSSNEFLNGHNALGQDQRQFYGAYDYWAEEAALGHNGFVSYNATATVIGGVSQPATNDPSKWIANQWGKFDPGLYDSANGTTDNYNNSAPAYVMAGGGPGSYTGAAWQIHFLTTAAQNAQGQYVVLSVGLAAAEGSLTIALNGHSETWHVLNGSDPMVRSGAAGFYQFLAYQYPIADLNAVGTDNVFTLSTSQTDGDLYDALRMEITNTSAAPATTGWSDYEYVFGSNSQTDAVESAASAASNSFNASSQWALTTGGTWSLGTSWTNYIIPSLASDVATFSNTITAPSTVTMDGNHTVGSIIFNSSSQAYTLAPGTGGTLTLNQSGGTAIISDLAGSHTIGAPVTLVSNTQVTVANLASTLTLSGAINGSGGLTVIGPGSVILAAANTYTGPTSVTSGTLTIGSVGSIASTSLSVSTGATLNINGSIAATTAIVDAGTILFGASSANGILNRTIGSLNLSSGGLATVAASTLQANRTLLVTGALNLSGAANNWLGKLDLKNNDLIVTNGNLANITNQIKAGYNGSSGILSTTAAADPTHLRTLGSRLSDGSSFDGATPAVTDVLVKYTYVGDANLDGKVDGSDYSRIDSGFLTSSTCWFNGDFNYDGLINGSDYTLIDNAFNTQAATITAKVMDPNAVITDQVASSASVPEPAGIVSLCLAASPLLRLRRRALQN